MQKEENLLLLMIKNLKADDCTYKWKFGKSTTDNSQDDHRYYWQIENAKRQHGTTTTRGKAQCTHHNTNQLPGHALAVALKQKKQPCRK
jgi:hypothetical protein